MSGREWIRRAVYVLFFLSGTCALIYEVLWVKILARILGNTTFAASIILAAFMAGLAIGSYKFGKLIDRKNRPLLTYAIIEAAIAFLALSLPFLFSALTPLYIWICRFMGNTPFSFRLAQIVFCFILILAPTTLMGGTLPILCRFAATSNDKIGRITGELYAANTLGAVVGCFIGGFFLIEVFGIQGTTHLTVGMNFGVAIIAGLLSVSLHRYNNAEIPPATASSDKTGRTNYGNQKSKFGPDNMIVWAIGLSGFTGLAYEIVWTRVLVFFSPGVLVYTFSTMLTLFLLGFAVGSYIGSFLADKIRPLRQTLAGLQTTLAFISVLSIPLVVRLNSLQEFARDYVELIPDPYWRSMTYFALACLALVFVPSVFLGATFPMASRIYTDNLKEIGHKIGTIYSANTIGAILGAIMAGLIFLPVLGTRRSLIFIALLNIIVAALILMRCLDRRIRVIFAQVTAAFLFLGGYFWMDQDAFISIFSKGNEEIRTVFAREGVGGTVTVHRLPDYSLQLAINGVNVSGTDFKFRTSQKLQAHIPLLIHSQAREILQIGFGSGETASSVTRHDIDHVDSVEISPAVIDAVGFFADVNQKVLDKSKLNLAIDDVRSFLVRGTRRYDVILSDSIHPTIAGNGSLYTVEYFRLCKDKLRTGGIFSTWAPLYELTPEDFKVILRSMKTVFSHVYLWHTPAGRNEWCILMGMMQPLSIDLRKLEQHFNRKAIREDLAAISVLDCRQLLSFFLLDNEGILQLIGQKGLCNTDDNSYLEYAAAKRYFGPVERHRGVKRILQELLVRRGDIVRYLKTGPGDLALKHYIMERDYILAGRLLELDSQFHLANMMYRRALELNPVSEVARDMLGCSHNSKAILLRALTENPKDYTICQNLGFSSLNAEDFSAATGWFKKVLETEPKSIDAHFGLAKAYFGLNKFDEAVEQLDIATKLGPVPWLSEKIRKGLNLIYAKRMVNYLPNSPEARQRLGLAYLERGSFDSALAELEGAVRLQPNSIMNHLNMATCYENALQFAKAKKGFLKVLELDRANRVAPKCLDRLSGRTSAEDIIAYATARLREPRNLRPPPYRSIHNYSSALDFWKQRRFTEATRELEKAVGYCEDHLPDLVSLYKIQGMYDHAIEGLQTMAKSNPEDRALKRELMELNLLKELKKIQKGPDANQKYCQILSVLANLYWQGGDFEEAEEALLKILALDPNAAVIHLNLGMCYEATGQLAKALDSYKTALEIDPHLGSARNTLLRLMDTIRKYGGSSIKTSLHQRTLYGL
ncbi:MAG: fused MFS/spermidine synthase [Thermodesulfobacteriota bacterium]